MFAVDDATIKSIADSLFNFLGMVFTGIMAYFMAKLNKEAKATTAKADEAKTTLAQTTAIVAEKLDSLVDATNQTNTLISENK